MILPILPINKRSDPLLPFPRGVSALQQGRNEVAAAPCDLCVLQGHWALVEGLGTPVEVGKAMICHDFGQRVGFQIFQSSPPIKNGIFSKSNRHEIRPSKAGWNTSVGFGLRNLWFFSGWGAPGCILEGLYNQVTLTWWFGLVVWKSGKSEGSVR